LTLRFTSLQDDVAIDERTRPSAKKPIVNKEQADAFIGMAIDLNA